MKQKIIHSIETPETIRKYSKSELRNFVFEYIRKNFSNNIEVNKKG